MGAGLLGDIEGLDVAMGCDTEFDGDIVDRDALLETAAIGVCGDDAVADDLRTDLGLFYLFEGACDVVPSSRTLARRA